jgi:hypothetical protein
LNPWAKMASDLDTDDKIMAAGRNAREVFLYALRKNQLGDYDWTIPAGCMRPAILARILMMSEDEAADGLAAGVTERLFEITWNGGYRIVHRRMSMAPTRADESSASTYVVRMGVNGALKIGRSKEPYNRIASLQTSCAEQLVILHLVPFDIEAELHRRLDRWRMRGEWFSAECMAELAVALRDIAEKGDAP